MYTFNFIYTTVRFSPFGSNLFAIFRFKQLQPLIERGHYWIVPMELKGFSSMQIRSGRRWLANTQPVDGVCIQLLSEELHCNIDQDWFDI